MEKYGFLTDTGISKAMDDHSIIIYPYTNKNLTPVGYNFSYSKFIVSLKKKNFVTLIDDQKTGELFFWLRPLETVLVLTKETVSVSSDIGGTFHSKVSLVIKGLGHVSTTLDPGWQGQLLVPLNNPTNRRIKVFLRESVYNEETKKKEIIENTFLTLVFYRAEYGATNRSSNKPARIELLEEIIKANKNNLFGLRSKLLEQVKKISNIYSKSENIIDLSTMFSRGNNFEKYLEQQKSLANNLDESYPLVKKAAHKLVVSGYVKFAFIGMINLAVLIGLAIFGYTTQNKVTSELLKILVPILTPFSVFFLTHIKDRFI